MTHTAIARTPRGKGARSRAAKRRKRKLGALPTGRALSVPTLPEPHPRMARG